MTRITKTAALSTAGLFLLTMLFYGCALTKVQVLQPSALKSMLGESGVAVIDARTDKEWNQSNIKIKDAVREDPDNVSSWADKYRNYRLVVVYCS